MHVTHKHLGLSELCGITVGEAQIQQGSNLKGTQSNILSRTTFRCQFLTIHNGIMLSYLTCDESRNNAVLTKRLALVLLPFLLLR